MKILNPITSIRIHVKNIAIGLRTSLSPPKGLFGYPDHDFASAGNKGAVREAADPIKHFLLAEVKWVGEPVTSLLSLAELEGCRSLLLEFVERTRREKSIPLPGDIQCIMGGPPCQDVSALNHKRQTVGMMEAPRFTTSQLCKNGALRHSRYIHLM